jgi:DNA invertase Pin-like site-specific DNA recombinase
MKNVVAYVRVSTDAQADEDKFGIEAQKNQIQNFCDKNDMTIQNWFIDKGESGVKESRPQLDRILYGDISNPPVEAVIVAKNDRMAREIKLYFYYKQLLYAKNIELVSVTEDFGEMGAFSGILEAFVMFAAEQERTNINKRTSGGRKVKAAKGGYSGGRAPMGYKIENKQLVVNPDEVPAVKFIFAQKEAGMTMLGTVDALNKAGYKTRNGKEFVISTVQSIWNNERTYRGEYRYGKDGEWVKGQHEPILDPVETAKKNVPSINLDGLLPQKSKTIKLS